MRARLLTVALRFDDDIVVARQRARQLTQLLGFDPQDQTRIATAVSEIARNATMYAGGGRVEFAVEGDQAPQVLVIEIIDQGPGIANLAEVLSGRYLSPTGMGLGILGARRLMDRCDVSSSSQGTHVTLRKVFPPQACAWGQKELGGLVGRIQDSLRQRPETLLDELKRQNHELIEALGELERRRRDLERLNAELADTNRGVLALYAELDEKADHLRRADELKTRFLSNMSHEFRTPLNSILGLTRILRDRLDGDLTAEQEKQVALIHKSATDLLELVNDLLDLAKVEAGKTTVRPTEFHVTSLFGALRGMLRPLLVSPAVDLVFVEETDLAPVWADEAKISQVLRNFISNALKFTERGEVRVAARSLAPGEFPPGCTEPVDVASILLSVADTGIGIAAEHHERIFEEFTQIEHHLQRHGMGTGLGLPLCRRLAGLLQGRVWVQSAPGAGSTFYLLIPQIYLGADELPLGSEPRVEAAVAETGVPVLLVEDRPEDRQIIESSLARSGFSLIATDRLPRARSLLATSSPAAVILDLLLVGEDTWRFLPEARQSGVPVIVVSTFEEQHKAAALGASAYGVKPVSREWILETLYREVLRPKIAHVLIADDDPAFRTVLRRMLSGVAESVVETADGEQALRIMRQRAPDLVILDLLMPAMDGHAVLQAMRADPALGALPALVCTSKELGPAEQARLASLKADILPKSGMERHVLLRAVLGQMHLRVWWPAASASLGGSEENARRAM